MDRFLYLSDIILFENVMVHAAMVFAVLALGLLLWWRFRKPVMPPAPSEEVIEKAAEDGEPELLANLLNEGPGQLLVRFQALNKDLEDATKDLQRYNGSRETQLQGWQQLTADVIRRILPVLANLEPYLDDSDTTAADVAQLAYGRLLTELVTIGVTQIIPSAGESFDGKYHVLGPDSEGYPPYRIKSVVQPGYRFQPRITGASEIVLKPAEVIVESDTEHIDAEPLDTEQTETEQADTEQGGSEQADTEQTDEQADMEQTGNEQIITAQLEIEPAVEEDAVEDDKVAILQWVPAAMKLDSDDEIEIRRMPLPDDDDDDDIMQVKRMPLPDEE